MRCFTFLCNMTAFQVFDISFHFCAILQLLLLHLGTDKWMCSLRHNVFLCDHLSGWKTIKFPLIWYIIYGYFWKYYMKNLNLKKCFTFFFCWVYISTSWKVLQIGTFPIKKETPINVHENQSVLKCICGIKWNTFRAYMKNIYFLLKPYL